MEYKRVKLTKVGLTGRIPDGLHPNGIEVGYIKEGYMVEPQSWNIISLMRYGVDIMRIA